MRKFIFIFCFLLSGFVFAQAAKPTATLFLSKTKKTIHAKSVKKSTPQVSAISSQIMSEIEQQKNDIQQLNQAVTDLKKQNEDLSSQQQQLTGKMEEILQQNTNLENQQKQMGSTIQQLTEQVNANNWRQYFSNIPLKLSNINLGFWLIVSGLLLLLLLLLCHVKHRCCLSRQKNKFEALAGSGEFSAKKINYNTIAGEDTMTSQLDLARAYIEMEDYDHAKSILENVLKDGSKEHKRIANELFVQIK